MANEPTGIVTSASTGRGTGVSGLSCKSSGPGLGNRSSIVPGRGTVAPAGVSAVRELGVYPNFVAMSGSASIGVMLRLIALPHSSGEPLGVTAGGPSAHAAHKK